MAYTFEEYEQGVKDVRLPSADARYALLGLAGEVGEIYSLFAKQVRDGRRDDFDAALKKELGDALWFITAIANDNGLRMDDLAQANITKLKDRQARNVLQGSGDNR